MAGPNKLPNYQLPVESYEKAQKVQREGRETRLDLVEGVQTGKK